MVVGTVTVAGLFDKCPNGCSNWLEIVELGTPKGIIYGTFIVSVVEAIRIMVILPSDYLRYRFIEPLKQSIFNRGKAEMHAEIVDWMERKAEHEREGKEFDEPMPSPDSNGASPGRNSN